MATPLQEALEIYTDYLDQIDTFCAELAATHADQIACKAGCSSCCTDLSLFPVEAAALGTWFLSLTTGKQNEIRHESTEASGPCPLLRNSLCLLYEGRPLICRTHGFPLMLRGDDGERIDCCRLNFTASEATLLGEAVLDLDALNEGLASINSIFLHELGWDDLAGERLSLLDAIGEPFLARLRPLLSTN